MPLNFLAYSRKVNCIKFQFQKGLNDDKPQAKNIHSSKPCFLEFTNLSPGDVHCASTKRMIGTEEAEG